MKSPEEVDAAYEVLLRQLKSLNSKTCLALKKTA